MNDKRRASWLVSLKADKLLHFICGLLIAQGLFLALRLGCTSWMAAIISLSATAVVAALKEVIDILYGTPEFKDWLASVIGAAIGIILMLLS